MKEKDVVKGQELETIDDELFGSFDAAQDSIGGGPYTITSSVTFSQGSFDHEADIDWNFEELERS